MQTNIWNLQNSKQRFRIRQRTQAHRLHLINLIKIKTNIDNNNKSWKTKSLNANYHKRIKQNIQKNNKELLHRINKAENITSSKIKYSTDKFSQYGDNLKIINSIHRYQRLKTIELQNHKIFDRLIHATPTISRQSWKKSQSQLQKYRFNRTLTKYTSPDYLKQAQKINKDKKMSFKHLKLSQCSQTLSSVRSQQPLCLRS